MDRLVGHKSDQQSGYHRSLKKEQYEAHSGPVRKGKVDQHHESILRRHLKIPL